MSSQKSMPLVGSKREIDVNVSFANHSSDFYSIQKRLTAL